MRTKAEKIQDCKKELAKVREGLEFRSNQLATLDYDTQQNEYEYAESCYLSLLGEKKELEAQLANLESQND